MSLLAGQERLQVRLGAAIIVGLCAAIAFVVFLADRIELTTQLRFEVMFAHAGPLRSGAPVVVAGRTIGAVETMRPVPHGVPGPLGGEAGVAARVRIDASAAWMIDASGEFFVSSRGPLAERFLEVGPQPCARRPATRPRECTADSVVPARPIRAGEQVRGVDPPSMDRVMQRTWENLQVTRRFFDELRPELDRLLATLDELARTLDAVEPAPGEFARLARETGALIGEARTLWTDVIGGSAGMDRIRATMATARTVMARAQTRLAELDARWQTLAAALGVAQDRIDTHGGPRARPARRRDRARAGGDGQARAAARQGARHRGSNRARRGLDRQADEGPRVPRGRQGARPDPEAHAVEGGRSPARRPGSGWARAVRPAVVTALAMLAGCELVFPPSGGGGDAGDDGDDGAPIDAGDGPLPPLDDAAAPRQCGPWGTGTMLGFGGVDPSLSEDETEIIYARHDGTSYELFRRTRSKDTDVFGPEEPLLALNTPANENDPALTLDGTMMLYASNVTGSTEIYETRRTSTGSPFQAPQTPVGLAGVGLNQGLDLTADGLTVYWDNGSAVVRARRPTQFQGFGGPEWFAPRSRYPGVSRDELELFHNDAGTLAMRFRTSPTDQWTGQVTLDADGGDGDLSYDLDTLVANSGPDLVVYRRMCN